MNNKEILDTIKQMVADGVLSQEFAEKYFPELTENEDEKIRKSLIYYFEDFHLDTFACLDPKKILAWLKKQGEQKPTNNQFTPEQASVLDKHIDKFVGQKPAWTEEDEEIINNIGEYLNCYGNYIADKNEEKAAKIYKAADWLKSRIPQNTWKPTEEQMKQLHKYCIDNKPLNELYEQLKAL